MVIVLMILSKVQKMNKKALLNIVCILCVVALGTLSCSSDSNQYLSYKATNNAPNSFASDHSLEPELSHDVASFIVHIPFGPVPFFASDGQIHLVYEILITNRSNNTIRFDLFEVLDDANQGHVLFSAQNAAISNLMTLISGGQDVHELQSNQTGIIYVDVPLNADSQVPDILVHRIVARNPDSPHNSDDVLGARIQVHSDINPPTLSPPALGDDWVSAEACCKRSHHRRGIPSFNGAIYLSQRFAIDFIQMVNGEIFKGDPAILSNWHVYGVELLAVADGVVTSVVNDQPDITPFQPNPNRLTKQTAAGNHVVVDLGNGLSYVFGHMQTGSVRVKEGDRVTKGQVLGLVGNSGNTDAPHLHVHVMTGPDIFQGRGIPYEFDNFTVTGSFPSIDDFIREPPGSPTNRVNSTPRILHNAYPLELDILNFGN